MLTSTSADVHRRCKLAALAMAQGADRGEIVPDACDGFITEVQFRYSERGVAWDAACCRCLQLPEVEKRHHGCSGGVSAGAAAGRRVRSIE